MQDLDKPSQIHSSLTLCFPLKEEVYNALEYLQLSRQHWPRQPGYQSNWNIGDRSSFETSPALGNDWTILYVVSESEKIFSETSFENHSSIYERYPDKKCCDTQRNNLGEAIPVNSNKMGNDWTILYVVSESGNIFSETAFENHSSIYERYPDKKCCDTQRNNLGEAIPVNSNKMGNDWTILYMVFERENIFRWNFLWKLSAR